MEAIRFPIFKDHFMKLRGALTQAQFADKLNISRPTVGLYESGARIPDALALRNIAEKCGVSADWLLGLVKDDTPDVNIQVVCRITNLREQAINTLQTHDSCEYTIQISDIINAVLCASSFRDNVLPALNNALNSIKPLNTSPEVKAAVDFAYEHGYSLLEGYYAEKFFIDEALATTGDIFHELLCSKYEAVTQSEDSNDGEHKED